MLRPSYRKTSLKNTTAQAIRYYDRLLSLKKALYKEISPRSKTAVFQFDGHAIYNESS